MANDSVKVLTGDNFDDVVLKSTGYTLVDFWASWCGPCRMVGPIIEELSEDYAGKISVGKVNVDENEDLAKKYSVQSIPTIILFKDGEIVDKLVGGLPKEQFEDMLDKHVG